MSEHERMAELDARLQALKSSQAEAESKPHADDHYTQVQMGWRMVIELVTGLLLGCGIGYGLDSLFGTLPIFLLLFTLLGLAAGIRVMLRSAQEIQAQMMTGADSPEKAKGPENGR